MSQAHSYDVQISPPDGGLLHARVSGTASVANTIAYWRQIARAAREHGARTVLLVDVMTGTPLAEADWLQVVTCLQDQGLQSLRVAHVKPLGLQQAEFCEIFARDAGIQARVFEDETEAATWLREGGQQAE